ncbi:MAG: hypothetical protein H6709_06355 [Kofleriaceae bacterium]|nr:hypothetical protein [Kofleriaceae bacterium]
MRGLGRGTAGSAPGGWVGGRRASTTGRGVPPRRWPRGSSYEVARSSSSSSSPASAASASGRLPARPARAASASARARSSSTRKMTLFSSPISERSLTSSRRSMGWVAWLGSRGTGAAASTIGIGSPTTRRRWPDSLLAVNTGE